MGLLDSYLEYHTNYEKKFHPNKVVVIMQVGKFYEMYQRSNTKSPDLVVLSKTLNIMKTSKTTKSETFGMIGFPIVSDVKFINLLTENQYTVVVIDEIAGCPKDDIKREVTKVYSPCVPIQTEIQPDNRFIVCYHVSEEKQRNGKVLECIGMASIDVTTGQVLISESFSSDGDPTRARDELSQFLNMTNPLEIICDDHSEMEHKQAIVHCVPAFPKAYSTISFQNEILKRAFPQSKSFIEPLNQLNLERNLYSNVALVASLEFLYEHNKKAITLLQPPQHVHMNKTVDLGNNCTFQLDLVSGLLPILDFTSTAMGKRMLKTRILQPLCDADMLNREYDVLEKMAKENVVEDLQGKLKEIFDLDRLQRMIVTETIHPFQFARMIESVKISLEVVGKMTDIIFQDGQDAQDDHISRIQSFLQDTNSIFDLEKMTTSISDSEHVFRSGIFPELDKKHTQLSQGTFSVEKEVLRILGPLKLKNPLSKLKCNSREGHYLLLTEKQASMINMPSKPFAKSFKISLPGVSKDDDLELRQEVISLNKKLFYESLLRLHSKFGDALEWLKSTIAQIDVFVSNSICSSRYKYSRPILTKSDSSFVKIKKLRHPIIERRVSHPYVSHDISIGGGKDPNILLFGLNGSGKSSMMKALGIAVIMAQCGMYVPCAEMELSPFESVYTRISGQDDLMRGLSSFAVEMLELKAILTRANPKMLVIGDEVCRGTENVSATSLVASALLTLVEKRASFIFATHLHDLTKISFIKQCGDIKMCHISVSTSEKGGDDLVFDRELKEGEGPTQYGITVAKHLLKNEKLIDLALKIRKEIDPISSNWVGNKTSRYNSQVWMTECERCGSRKDLHTHHIQFQKDFKDDVSNSVHSRSNLIVLCEECHVHLHKGEFHISGLIMTSEGREPIVLNTKEMNG